MRPLARPDELPRSYAEFLERFLDGTEIVFDGAPEQGGGLGPTYSVSLREASAVLLGAPAGPSRSVRARWMSARLRADDNRARLLNALAVWWAPGGLAAHQDHGYTRALGDLLAVFGQYCAYCGVRGNSGLDVEHVLPKSIFLLVGWEWKNFLPACRACNTIKGVRPDLREAFGWGYRPPPADEQVGAAQPAPRGDGTYALQVPMGGLGVGDRWSIVVHATVSGARVDVLAIALGGVSPRDWEWAPLPASAIGASMGLASYDAATQAFSLTLRAPVGTELTTTTYVTRFATFHDPRTPAGVPAWLRDANNLGWPDSYGAALLGAGGSPRWMTRYELLLVGEDGVTRALVEPRHWRRLAELHAQGAVYFDAGDLRITSGTWNANFEGWPPLAAGAYALRCQLRVPDEATAAAGLRRVLDDEADVNRVSRDPWSTNRRVELRTRALLRAVSLVDRLRATFVALGDGPVFGAIRALLLRESAATGFCGVWMAVMFQNLGIWPDGPPTNYTQPEVEAVFPGTVSLDFV